MDKYLKEARLYFDSLSTEELKTVLTEAGFEVREGSGKIIFTELEGFIIKTTFKANSKQVRTKRFDISPFPVAS
ncbi:MAG: hypothetical protein KGZ57_09075 [Dethiobacter sp.]|nr:hypothetical protein [Dethiobacter sp.]